MTGAQTSGIFSILLMILIIFLGAALLILVPKLCLGMPMSRQLYCPSCETEFRRQTRSQTEFGNEAGAEETAGAQSRLATRHR
jgi:hypothetical protein